MRNPVTSCAASDSYVSAAMSTQKAGDLQTVQLGLPQEHAKLGEFLSTKRLGLNPGEIFRASVFIPRVNTLEPPAQRREN